MGILSDVMEYKARKEAQDSQAWNAIPNAINGFIQGRQQQIENQKSMLDTQIAAAKAGLRIENGRLIPDETLQQNAQRSVYSFNPLNGQLEPTGVIKKGDIVRNTLSEEDIKKKSEIQRSTITENPEIDAPTQAALAGAEFLQPRIDRVKEILQNNPWGEEGFSKLVKQLVFNPETNELIIPDDFKNDQSLEEFVGLINDMRITGFGLAGSAFTEFEGKRVESGLDPRGKSTERYIQDLNRVPDFFKAKVKAGTTGLKEVREKYGKQEVFSYGKKQQSSDSGSFVTEDMKSQAAKLLAQRRNKK